MDVRRTRATNIITQRASPSNIGVRVNYELRGCRRDIFLFGTRRSTGVSRRAWLVGTFLLLPLATSTFVLSHSALHSDPNRSDPNTLHSSSQFTTFVENGG